MQAQPLVWVVSQGCSPCQCPVHSSTATGVVPQGATDSSCAHCRYPGPVIATPSDGGTQLPAQVPQLPPQTVIEMNKE